MKDEQKHLQECGMKMHSTVTVWTKGQVVIPQEVREMLGIKPGDVLMVITKHDTAVGMVKIDDVPKMMQYMQQEMETNSK